MEEMKLDLYSKIRKLFSVLWKNKLKVVVVILILYIAQGFFFKEDQQKALLENYVPTIITTEKGNLESAIEVTWKSKLVNERKLRFLQTGKVVESNFKNGDLVKKGQVISRLDTKDAKSEIEQAKIALDNARARYTKMVSDNSEQNLDYKNKIQDLKKRVEIAKGELAKMYLDQEQQLKDTKLTLENEKSNLDTKVNNKDTDRQKIIDDLEKKKKDLARLEAEFERYKAGYDNELLKIKKEGEDSVNAYYRDLNNFKTTLSSESQAFKDALNTLNNITGYDKTELKDTGSSVYEVFSNQNNEYRLKAAGAALGAQEAFDKIEKNIEVIDAKSQIVIQDLIDYRKSLKNLYFELNRAFDYAYKGLNETASSDKSGLVSSYKGSASSMRDSYLSKYNDLDSEVIKLETKDSPEQIKLDNEQKVADKEKEYEDKEKNLKDTKESVENEIENLPNKLKEFDIAFEKAKSWFKDSMSNIDELKKTHERQLDQKKNDIKSLEDELKKTSKNYDDTSEGPKSSDLVIANNEIKQAELRLKNANDKLKDYEIIAPFDGIIRKTEVSFGDTIKSDSNKSIYIENPNLVQIDLELDQVDVVRVTKGQEVNVTFDAYQGKEFKGIITEIDTTPVDKNGSIAYKTSVELQKGEEKVLTWMTAKAKILLQNKENVLTVPNSAIEIDPEGKSYVNVWLGNAKKKVYVETGLTNGTKTEVVSGIEEGTEIVEINFDANTKKAGDFENDNGGYYG